MKSAAPILEMAYSELPGSSPNFRFLESMEEQNLTFKDSFLKPSKDGGFLTITLLVGRGIGKDGNGAVFSLKDMKWDEMR